MATGSRFRRDSCRGFTYVALLMVIAIMSAGLAATGVVFHQQSRRDKEQELLFAGDQIQRAIARYYENSPNGATRFPQSLEDLLRDARYPGTRRYLRRIYHDPLTGTTDWGLVRTVYGGIIGVYSNSDEEPLMLTNFPSGYEDFRNRKSYRDWKFIYPAGYGEIAPANPGTAVPLSR